MNKKVIAITVALLTIGIAGAGVYQSQQSDEARSSQAAYITEIESYEDALKNRHESIQTLVLDEDRSLNDTEQIIQLATEQQDVANDHMQNLPDYTSSWFVDDGALPSEQAVRDDLEAIATSYDAVIARAELEIETEKAAQTYRSSAGQSSDYLAQLETSIEQYSSIAETEFGRENDEALFETFTAMDRFFRQAINADNEADYNQALARHDSEYEKIDALNDQYIAADRDYLDEISQKIDALSN